MKNLTNNQLMYVYTLKILNFPIMAKALEECFKNDIDIGGDNAMNYVMPFLTKMPTYEAVDLVLELERFPNTKEEFESMINMALAEWRAKSMNDNFDVDSKIIN